MSNKNTVNELIRLYLLANGISTTELQYLDGVTSNIQTQLNARPWTQLGRTTLTVAGDTITVSSLTASTYLCVIASLIDVTDVIQPAFQFNADTGANYAMRASTNGGADATGTSATSINPAISAANRMVWTMDIWNLAAQEKLCIGQFVHRGAAGAATAPAKAEIAGKWANTADQITRVDCINLGAGDFNIGSEVVVFGMV